MLKRNALRQQFLVVGDPSSAILSSKRTDDFLRVLHALRIVVTDFLLHDLLVRSEHGSKSIDITELPRLHHPYRNDREPPFRLATPLHPGFPHPLNDARFVAMVSISMQKENGRLVLPLERSQDFEQRIAFYIWIWKDGDDKLGIDAVFTGELTKVAFEQRWEKTIVRSSLGIEAEHELLDGHYTALATKGVFGVA